MTATEIVLDPRFNGPPESANGGYAAGMVARLAGGTPEVTLRSPPPLGRPLRVQRDGDRAVTVHDGETGAVVAEAVPASGLEPLSPPVRPSFDDAAAAARRHSGIGRRHLMSDCAVCSPYRADSFGLHTGPLASDPAIGAAAWIPAPDLAEDGSDRVRSEFVWAALDCPSYTPAMQEDEAICLLGRFSATIARPVRVGERIAAVGWALETDGRKRHTASALIDEGGDVIATARALWITLRS